VLKTYGVSHVLSPFPQHEASFTLVSGEKHAYVYRVEGATRTRFVRSARRVSSDQETVTRLLDPGFDPDREILLAEAPLTIGPALDEAAGPASAAAGESTSSATGSASVTRENSDELLIDAEAPANGYLLLADTFYPGWTASVDGTATPIYRANLSVRGIELPKGRHQVRFVYEAPGFWTGLRITLLALSALVIWAGVAVYLDRRAEARRSEVEPSRK
jgi:hypothetical protein